jgi:hypothetical protein
MIVFFKTAVGLSKNADMIYPLNVILGNASINGAIVYALTLRAITRIKECII